MIRGYTRDVFNMLQFCSIAYCLTCSDSSISMACLVETISRTINQYSLLEYRRNGEKKTWMTVVYVNKLRQQQTNKLTTYSIKTAIKQVKLSKLNPDFV